MKRVFASFPLLFIGICLVPHSLIPAFGREGPISKEVIAMSDKEKLVVWQWEKDPNDVFYRIVEEFQAAHPDIDVRIEDAGVSTAFYRFNFITEVRDKIDRGVSLPDVMIADSMWIPELVDRNALIPLDGLLDEIGRKNFFEGFLSGVTYRGSAYGLPVAGETLMLACDMEALGESGVEAPPRNWDELRKCVIKIGQDKDESGIPDRWPLKFTMSSLTKVRGAEVALSLLRQNGGFSLTDGRLEVDSQESIDALQFFTDLHYKYNAYPIELHRDRPSAMEIVYTWSIEDYHMDQRYAIVPLPQGKQAASFLHLFAVVIFNTSPDRIETAKKFARWIWDNSEPFLSEGILSANKLDYKDTPFQKLLYRLAESSFSLPLVAESTLAKRILNRHLYDAIYASRTPQEALIEAQEELDRLSEGKGAVPPRIDPDAESSIFGICHGFNSPLMRQAGIRWTRNDFSWGGIEPRPGEFNWSRLDSFVDGMKEIGVEILPILDYTVRWATTAPDIAERPDMYMPDVDAFTNYVSKCVARYRGKIKYWEIWNEPNIPLFWKPYPCEEDYVKLLKASYVAAKEADPTCSVLAGGISGVDNWWYQRLYELGAWDYFDIVNIHPYTGEDELDRGNYLNQLRAVKEMTQRYGGDKPIWITEVGSWATDPEDPESYDLQARALAKMYVETIASRAVDKVFFYNFSGREGIVEDGNPKPSFYAHRQVVKNLSDVLHLYTLAKRSSVPNMRGHIFRRSNGELLLVIWSITDEPFFLDVPYAVEATTYLGEPIEIGEDGKIQVGRAPIYIKAGRVSLDELLDRM